MSLTSFLSKLEHKITARYFPAAFTTETNTKAAVAALGGRAEGIRVKRFLGRVEVKLPSNRYLLVNTAKLDDNSPGYFLEAFWEAGDPDNAGYGDAPWRVWSNETKNRSISIIFVAPHRMTEALDTVVKTLEKECAASLLERANGRAQVLA